MLNVESSGTWSHSKALGRSDSIQSWNVAASCASFAVKFLRLFIFYFFLFRLAEINNNNLFFFYPVVGYS